MHLWEIHPAVVHFPIAFLVAGFVLDLYANSKARPDIARVAQGSLIAGLLTGVVAAVFGVAAFLTVPQMDTDYRNYFAYHFGANALALAAFAVPVIARRRGVTTATTVAPVTTGMRLVLPAEILGVCLLLVGGTFGHALVMHAGAGIRPDLLGAKSQPREHVLHRPSASPANAPGTAPGTNPAGR